MLIVLLLFIFIKEKKEIINKILFKIKFTTKYFRFLLQLFLEYLINLKGKCVKLTNSEKFDLF